MNKEIIGLLTFLILGSTSALSSTDPNATKVEAASIGQDSVVLEGKLKCYYSKAGNMVSFVELVKNSDGESVSISSPSDDLKAACGGQRLTAENVKVEGRMTSRFLLWGGNLEVNSFRVSKN